MKDIDKVVKNLKIMQEFKINTPVYNKLNDDPDDLQNYGYVVGYTYNSFNEVVIQVKDIYFEDISDINPTNLFKLSDKNAWPF